MRNHTTTAARADIGRTPQLCQDALIEMLKELFAGKLFCGQEGRKALKIYKQDLPIHQTWFAQTSAFSFNQTKFFKFPQQLGGFVVCATQCPLDIFDCEDDEHPALFVQPTIFSR